MIIYILQVNYSFNSNSLVALNTLCCHMDKIYKLKHFNINSQLTIHIYMLLKKSQVQSVKISFNKF